VETELVRRTTQSTPFFSEVEQLAAIHRLGNLRASYTRAATSNGNRLFLNAIVWLTSSALGFIFVVAIVVKLSWPGPYAGMTNYLTAAVLGIIGSVILAGCVRQGLLHWKAYRTSGREQVHIYEDGLVYLTEQSASHVFSWEEIAACTRGDIEDEVAGKVTLDHLYLDMNNATSEGESQFFFRPDLPQRLEICEQIELTYAQARFPALLEQYQKGERLEFTNLVINRSGINKALADGLHDVLPWDQVETFEVGQPYTTIKARRSGANSVMWFKEFTCEIADACLLKALVAEIRH
jgi:hypothetical protein